MTAVFVESALRHAYVEEDFYEVLEPGPLKLRSRRGLEGVYGIYGRNYAGDYLHVAYRREAEQVVVFHMRRMTASEKRFYSQHR